LNFIYRDRDMQAALSKPKDIKVRIEFENLFSTLEF